MRHSVAAVTAPFRHRCVVLGDGPRKTEWVIVGQAPADTEVDQGKPFVGKAGARLNQALFAARVPFGGLHHEHGSLPTTGERIPATMRSDPGVPWTVDQGDPVNDVAQGAGFGGDGRQGTDRLMLSQHVERSHCLLANLNAFVFDYVARQKLGGTHLAHFIMKQMSIVPPASYDESTPWDSRISLSDWLARRVLELSYTAHDLSDLGTDLGWNGGPFRWNPDRRAVLRAELDACYFLLYGRGRDDADYIMETFPIVRRNDEKSFGDYRTKRLALQGYEAMVSAMKDEHPYQTALDPPPADPTIAERGLR